MSDFISNDLVERSFAPIVSLSDDCENSELQVSPFPNYNEENIPFEEKLRMVTKMAEKSGYTDVVIKAVLREVTQNPAIDCDSALRLLVDKAKELEKVTGIVVRHPLETIVQQIPTVEKLDKNQKVKLKYRHIVIDGSNLAMSHGGKKMFSCRGIQLCVEYFLARGHKGITAFVPEWRKEAPKPDAPISNQEILMQLEAQGYVTFTPSRRVRGRRRAHHDDYFVVKLAAEIDGVIVSNDNFRDIQHESPKWRKVIEKQLLMYSFVRDIFMPVEDPLGRHGPTLDAFLIVGVHPDSEVTGTICPYGRRCTYGNKCKYVHPEKVREEGPDFGNRQTPSPLPDSNSDASNSIRRVAHFNMPCSAEANKAMSADTLPGEDPTLVSRDFDLSYNPWNCKTAPNFGGSVFNGRRDNIRMQNMNFPFNKQNTKNPVYAPPWRRHDYDTYEPRPYSEMSWTSCLFRDENPEMQRHNRWSRGDQQELKGPTGGFPMQQQMSLSRQMQQLSFHDQQQFNHHGSNVCNPPIRTEQPQPPLSQQQNVPTDTMSQPAPYGSRMSNIRYR